MAEDDRLQDPRACRTPWTWPSSSRRRPRSATSSWPSRWSSTTPPRRPSSSGPWPATRRSTATSSGSDGRGSSPTSPARVNRSMLWDVEAPDYDEARAFMSARQAMGVALRAETKAHEFFVKALPRITERGGPDPLRGAPGRRGPAPDPRPRGPPESSAGPRARRRDLRGRAGRPLARVGRASRSSRRVATPGDRASGRCRSPWGSGARPPVLRRGPGDRVGHLGGDRPVEHRGNDVVGRELLPR